MPPLDGWWKRTFKRYIPRDMQSNLLLPDPRPGHEGEITNFIYDNTELENQYKDLKHRALRLGLFDMASDIDDTIELMALLRKRAGHKWTRRREKLREWNNIVGRKVGKDEDGDWIHTGAFGDLFIRLKERVKDEEALYYENNVYSQFGQIWAQGLRHGGAPSGPGDPGGGYPLDPQPGPPGPYPGGPAGGGGSYGPHPGPTPTPPSGPEFTSPTQPSSSEPTAQYGYWPASQYGQYGQYAPQYYAPAYYGYGHGGYQYPPQYGYGGAQYHTGESYYAGRMAAWMQENPEQAKVLADSYRSMAAWMQDAQPGAVAPEPDVPTPTSGAPRSAARPKRRTVWRPSEHANQGRSHEPATPST